MVDRRPAGGLPGPLAALTAKLAALVRSRRAAREPAAGLQADEETAVCCRGAVHIAYRGASDDRLYVAYGRKWIDVKFFKPRGLRVFCAGCRRRLL